MVIWEWFRKEPLVDVRLFKIFNFASSNLMFFALGVALLGGTVLMPLFLQTLMGYRRKQPEWSYPVQRSSFCALCRSLAALLGTSRLVT